MDVDDRLIGIMYKLNDDKISKYSRKSPADDSLVEKIGESLIEKRTVPWYFGVHEGIVIGFNSGVKQYLEEYLSDHFDCSVKIRGDRKIQSIRFIEYYFYNVKID